MKKYSFLILLAFALLLAKPAFALQCKAGNGGMESDECWTEVKISIVETNPVIRGTVLYYENSTDSSEENGFEARVSSTPSNDRVRVAGVAQRSFATGDTARILVRGSGALRVTQTVATGDLLYVGGSDAGTAGRNAAASRDQAIAFARQASTTQRATIDAYIVVI